MLAELIQRAAEGDSGAARDFYVKFLREELFVPNRYQDAPLTDSPQYPSELTSLLGVQDGARVVIPVFSRSDGIYDWCAQKLSFRSVRGSDLLKLVPEGWWIVVNPSDEYEKELSPWEIAELTQGEGAIEEIVSELFAEVSEGAPLELSAIEESEFQRLFGSLRDFAQSDARVLELKAARQESSEDEGLPAVIIVAAQVKVSSFDELRSLHRSLLSVAETAMIGGLAVRVFAGGEGFGEILPEILRDFPSFFARAATAG